MTDVLSMKSIYILLCLFFWTLTSVVYAEGKELEIGVILPLSGELASIGDAVRNGITIAIKKYPAKFDGLKFIYDDSRYDPKTSLSAYKRIRQRTSVKLTYIWGSPTCVPIIPVAEREKYPLLCFSGDPKEKRKYVFSFNSPATDYASVLTGFLESTDSPDIAIIYSQMQFFESLVGALEEQIKTTQELYSESVLPSAQDFSLLVSKLKSKKFQTLALFLLPHQLPTMLKRIAIMDYRPVIIGADSFADLQMTEELKEVLGKAVYVDMTVDSDFTSEYIREYENSNNLTLAYNGYHFALMMSDVFKSKKHTLNTEDLLKELRAYKELGAGISFKEDPAFGQYFSFPVELKKVSNGE